MGNSEIYMDGSFNLHYPDGKSNSYATRSIQYKESRYKE